MFKKAYVFCLMMTVTGFAFADAVISENDIYSGEVVKTDSDSVLLEMDSETRLFSLNDIKGFCYDGSPVLALMADGNKYLGTYEGFNGKEVIFTFGNGMETVNITDLSTVSPVSRRLFSKREIGLINGAQLLGNTTLNAQIAGISGGGPLPVAGYAGGVYINSRVFLSPKVALMAGGSLCYLPSRKAVLTDSESGTEYATLYADTVKVGIPLGAYYEISPVIEVGLSVTPSLNITSVYQSYNTNSVDNVYITHTSVGLRPALELNVTLAKIVSLGLSAGYELLSVCDGVYIELRTGIKY